MKWLSKDCRCCRESLGASINAHSALRRDETTAMDRHLTTCAECRAFQEEIKKITTPWADWEKSFSHIQAELNQRTRWAQAIRRAAAPSNPSKQGSRILELGEFFLSLRWHLTGMSAVWLLVAFLTRDPSAAPATTMAGGNTTSTQQLVASLRENRRILMGLINSPVTTDTEPSIVPQTPVPRRRSERQPYTALV